MWLSGRMQRTTMTDANRIERSQHVEVQRLIATMAASNRTWGEERIAHACC